MKDQGGGTWGAQEGASHRSMSLRSLLRELARKYDQYDDYGQQDAHELLRHLLDSMEMEEKDVLKRLQPEPIDKGKKRRGSKRPSNAGISPMPSPLPSPAPSAPSSPTRQTSNPILRGSQTIDSTQVPTFEEVPEDKRLVPFVNVLFGGSLASVVVCENCKSVCGILNRERLFANIHRFRIPMRASWTSRLVSRMITRNQGRCAIAPLQSFLAIADIIARSLQGYG
jgi:ubiquitin carboxyl-terminal hydrolase 16/45